MRLTILIGFALLAASSPLPARENAGGRIEWETDVSAALAKARETNRPLFLYFTHDD